MAEQQQVPAEGEVLVWRAGRDGQHRPAWRLVNQFAVERGRVTYLSHARYMGRTATAPVVVPRLSSWDEATGLVWAAVTGVSE